MYPENNGEVLPKLRLGREQNMEANPSTHPWAIQETWTIRKEIPSQIYTDQHTNDRVSLLDGRRLTRLRDLRPTTIRKRGDYLYLGWRWRQASGAVASRCSGEATQCR
jgi:hypothetical protein